MHILCMFELSLMMMFHAGLNSFVALFGLCVVQSLVNIKSLCTQHTHYIAVECHSVVYKSFIRMLCAKRGTEAISIYLKVCKCVAGGGMV